MDRAKLDVIRHILLHPFWIILSLVGVFFFFFVLNRGGVYVFLWTGGFFLLFHLVQGGDGVKAVPLYHRLLLGICLSLVLMSLVFSYEQTDTHRLFRIGQMLVIVFCVGLISRTETTRHAYRLVGTVLTVSIIWQFIARSQIESPYGTWSNPHYLANFAIFTLPLVFYYFMTVPKPYKVLFLLLFVIDIDPVFRYASRPAFLALFVSTVFVTTFLTRSRYRWFGLLAICVGLLLLGITNYAGFFDKLKELIATISNEERVHIWKYSLEMLQDNSPSAWLVGNGIGSSAEMLPKYMIPDPLYQVYQAFPFQHNFLLQILFENGIIGTVLVFGGLALLLVLFIKLSRSAAGVSLRLLINCMMAVFLNCLIFTGLTTGFYSKYTLYPMGFIIGTLFVLAEEVHNGP
jgi:O-antigen ligase